MLFNCTYTNVLCSLHYIQCSKIKLISGVINSLKYKLICQSSYVFLACPANCLRFSMFTLFTHIFAVTADVQLAMGAHSPISPLRGASTLQKVSTRDLLPFPKLLNCWGNDGSFFSILAHVPLAGLKGVIRWGFVSYLGLLYR